MIRMFKATSVWVALWLVLGCQHQIASMSTFANTSDAVMSGKRCYSASGGLQAITCEYRVGQDLYFTIDGVGEAEAGITFMRSNFDGDFYATVGALHGCVIVKRGLKHIAEPFLDYAFVSPKNGKVYRNWKECAEAA